MDRDVRLTAPGLCGVRFATGWDHDERDIDPEMFAEVQERGAKGITAR